MAAPVPLILSDIVGDGSVRVMTLTSLPCDGDDAAQQQ
jgi:hypothetical protein